jgi:hypothetical protein
MPSETIPMDAAARALNVTTSFVARLVESGKIRSENGLPNRVDIDRLAADALADTAIANITRERKGRR